jgi:hypothetical protein
MATLCYMFEALAPSKYLYVRKKCGTHQSVEDCNQGKCRFALEVSDRNYFVFKIHLLQQNIDHSLNVLDSQ